MENLNKQEITILLRALDLYEGHGSTPIMESAQVPALEEKLENSLRILNISEA